MCCARMAGCSRWGLDLEIGVNDGGRDGVEVFDEKCDSGLLEEDVELQC